jgi:hypothetical protein
MSANAALPKWPNDESRITVKEAAELINQHKATPILREHQVNLRDRLNRAAFDGDYESYMAIWAGRPRPQDSELRLEIAKNVTVKEILAAAKVAGVPLRRPSLDIPFFAEPDETFLLEGPGFRKIISILFNVVSTAEVHEVTAPLENKPKPEKAKKINEKRFKIIAALPTLIIEPDWADLGVLQRCHRVEQHFKEKDGWCPVRTYHRAMADYQKAQSTTEGSATSAT